MAHLRHNSAAPFQVPKPTTATNMDEIDTVHEVLTGHKRSDNGFTSFQVSKAIESVKRGCSVVVSDKNVRARLKTLKKEYAEGKLDFGKWRTKLCRRYDEIESIFGNDTATGDHAVSGFDNFSPIQVDDSVNEVDTPTEDTNPSPNPMRKRHADEGTTIGRRKRTKPYDDNHRSLALIAES
ncbi:Uncharacterized protein Adt_20964 [Abeliophyllum distichum]|uniref:Myb/SANT-like domain-containing protein n=1 Tax=Abeliophyllum distichum TaxID=126358 RepID=A0ABD1SY59_9LAMI